ncbi:hypothetical protein FCIRC_13274 [Fusarium circinatum]|uniref:Uncharacterized protein n=1 Tax=Fusarium circinatum TaxID=48490 RepID=A0A8H5SUP1_FUSCI|nr:hypothetical protein FCIRC_13274 [Fusarium circinatum]
MDKRKRDSNESPSSHVLENDRAKRVNIEGSSNAVGFTRENDGQRIIRRTGPYTRYRPVITNDEWEYTIGRNIPLNRQILAYHTSGRKAFVDSMAKDIIEGRSDMYDGHRELFTVCTRVFLCSPISPFSPLYGLSCDAPLSDQTASNDNESPWSQTSVRQLTEIMTHSVFRGDMSHLATIIQYAIIMRTGDRRPWVMAIDKPSCSGRLDRLQQRIIEETGADGMLQSPISALYHSSGRSYFTETCVLSDVMCSLEHIIKPPSKCTPGALYHLSKPVYHVTAIDINNVQLAIDNSNWDGTPRFPSRSQCYKVFMERPEKPEGGPDFNQLAGFYCRAWHFEERKLAASIESWY